MQHYTRGPRLEVRNDFLGIGQVYFGTEHGRWLLSNSVELLARIIRSAELDPLGMSFAISFGWVSGVRTLHRTIRVLPEAAHWKWEGIRNDPVKSCDYPLSRLWSHPRVSRFGYSEAVELAAKLAGICAELSRHQGVLKCPLTGGRDSRALVLLMMHADIPIQYYTDVFPGSEADVVTGQQIAQRFGLSYDLIRKDVDDLICDWSRAMDQLIRQNDGMVSLWQMVDVLGRSEPERSPSILIWGIGGEIGRANFDHPKWHHGLETRNSHVWNYIRRPQFDSLLSKTTSPEARQRHLPLLLQVLTLLRYEQLPRGTVEKYVE